MSQKKQPCHLFEEHKHEEKMHGQKAFQNIILKSIVILCLTLISMMTITFLHDILLAPVKFEANCQGTGININSNDISSIQMSINEVLNITPKGYNILDNSTIQCEIQANIPLMLLTMTRK